MITQLVDLLQSGVDLIDPGLVAAEDEVPTPGGAEMPEGFDNFTTLLSWVKWVCLGVTIISLMVAGARMGFGSRQGDGEEHASRVGQVLIGVILVSAAASMVSFLLTTGAAVA